MPSTRWRELSEFLLQDFAERFRIQACGSIASKSPGDPTLRRRRAPHRPPTAGRTTRSESREQARLGPSYVRATRFSDLPGVTRTLEVGQRHRGFIWSTVATLSPRPPSSVTAHLTRDYALERSTITDTLNFVIHCRSFWRNLRLTARVTGADGTEYDSSATRLVDATLLQTLRLRAIMVSYSGARRPRAPKAGCPCRR